MASREAKNGPTVGFFTVVRHPQHGLFGGYLLLTANGRPVEFHCTAPVKPNRAQEILFGPTLEPYLHGEQIGKTLLEKASMQPGVVLTDLAAALAVREHVELPVALVLADEAPVATPEECGAVHYRVDAAHEGPAFRVGRHRLAVARGFAGDEPQVATRLTEVAERLDLAEPFGRIREALEEAQRGGR